MAKQPRNPYYHPEEQGRQQPVRRQSPYQQNGRPGANPAGQRAAQAARKKAAAKRRRKRQLAILGIVLAACAVLVFAVYHILNGLVTGGGAALPAGLATEDALKGDVVNILCAGIDYDEDREYPDGMGFTDVILYVSFDMKANKISMLQIPRDTYIGDTASTGGTGKINAVALHGDTNPPVAALASVVNDQLKLPVDYYVTIDMDAFKAVINAIGGIEVTVPFDITDDHGNTLHAGTQRIDGATAEFMVRQRHNYSNADIGRLEMQRYMYSALLKTFKSFPLSDIVKVLPAYIQYVKTDIDLAKMASLASKVIKVPSENIGMFKLPGEACTVNAQSVFTLHLNATAELLNTYFRPYADPVPAEALGVIELQNTTGDLDLTAGQSMNSIDNGTAEWGKTNVETQPQGDSSSAPAA